MDDGLELRSTADLVVLVGFGLLVFMDYGYEFWFKGYCLICDCVEILKF